MNCCNYIMKLIFSNGKKLLDLNWLSSIGLLLGVKLA